MKINRSLNLVIPILDAEGTRTVAHVHSAPISVEVFDTFFLPLSKTFASIYAEGLGVLAGPRVADKLLRKIATDMGVWDGDTGVARGLIAEIHRLTNVLMIGKDGGWEAVPYDSAKKMGAISTEDAAEVEAGLTFFTVAWSMHHKSDRAGIMASAGKLWGARLESLSSSELLNSLRTSMTDASTGKVAAA